MTSVDHPDHYNQYQGVECIDIAEELNFNLGNAYKYVFRAGEKGDMGEDLKKALWCLQREKTRIQNHKQKNTNILLNNVRNLVLPGKKAFLLLLIAEGQIDTAIAYLNSGEMNE